MGWGVRADLGLCGKLWCGGTRNGLGVVWVVCVCGLETGGRGVRAHRGVTQTDEMSVYTLPFTGCRPLPRYEDRARPPVVQRGGLFQVSGHS